MVRVLVSGFEPFAGEVVNPSWEVAEQLTRTACEGIEIIALRLPVARFRSVALALDTIGRTRPDIVIALGQAGGRTAVTPERLAINLDDYRIPDNAGNCPTDEPIVPNAPVAYWCTLPVKRVVDAIRSAGVPAAISNTAGTYLCNHVAFGILHHVATARLPVLAGFVHLPYLPEQAMTKPGPPASLSMDQMVTAMTAGIRSVAEVLQSLVTSA